MNKVNRNNVKIVIYLIILTIASCNLKEEKKITDPELIHVLSINNCDSLMADEIFKKHNQIKWPDKKPKSVVEAVLKLDKMTNAYNKHLFRICEPIEFHLGFGMMLRNEWIHTGEEELKDQLFNKLKLKHFDYSSGLILGLFGEYIKNGEIHLMEQLGDHLNADSMKTARIEFQKIEDELNKIKKKNGG
ncbi:MAG: hypothetical protein JNN28_22255 [Saprospiraceae bacterium]|nr:hypothetical protein [Saprospiraceae bacterium]